MVKTRWRKRLLRTARWTALLVALLFLSATASRLYIGHRLERGHAALREAGIPVSMEELERAYDAVCPDTGAAALYREAFAAMDNCSIGLLHGIEAHDYPWLSEFDRACIEDAVEKNERAIVLLHEAARRPCARFALDELEIALAAEIPEDYRDMLSGRLRQAARLLRGAAIERLAAGDSMGAAAHLIDIVGLSRHQAQAPLLGDLLMAAGNAGIAEDAVSTGLRMNAWQASDVLALAQAFAAYEETVAAMPFAPGEYVVYSHFSTPPQFALDAGSWLLQDLPSLRMEDVTAITDALPWPVSVLGAIGTYSRLTYLPILQELDYAIRRAPLPGNRPYAETKPLNEELLGMTVVPHGSAMAWKARYFLIAKARMLTLACTIEAACIQQGTCPETLAKIAPGFPVEDPMDGAPLRYRRAGEGFVIHSVGYNLEDNGGGLDMRELSARCDDIVLNIAR